MRQCFTFTVASLSSHTHSRFFKTLHLYYMKLRIFVSPVSSGSFLLTKFFFNSLFIFLIYCQQSGGTVFSTLLEIASVHHRISQLRSLIFYKTVKSRHNSVSRELFLTYNTIFIHPPNDMSLVPTQSLIRMAFDVLTSLALCS